jgi:hypothetical protein
MKDAEIRRKDALIASLERKIDEMGTKMNEDMEQLEGRMEYKLGNRMNELEKCLKALLNANPSARPAPASEDSNAPARPLTYSAALRKVTAPKAKISPVVAARVCFEHTFERPPARTFKNIYIRCYVPRTQKDKNRYKLVRTALTSKGVTTGVFDMSFIGKCIVHLLVDSAEHDSIVTKLGDDIVIKNFDPLELPDHLHDAPEAQQHLQKARNQYIERIAILLTRNSGTREQAIMRDVPEDLYEDILDATNKKLAAQREKAAESGARLGARPPPAIDHGKEQISGDEIVDMEYEAEATLKRARSPANEEEDGFQTVTSKRSLKKGVSSQ